METNSQIRKEVSKSKLRVSKLSKSDYQKEGTLTAELRQEVITESFYPTKSIANSLNDNIFSMKDFNFEEKNFENTEKRVGWIDVPATMTLDQVAKQLESVSGATLYRILSNKPIISDTEQYAIESTTLDVTLDTFANRQVVRIPEGQENAGALALNNGKPQYRRIAFSKTPKEDDDTRTSDPSDFYASPEIKAEMNNTVHIGESQTL